MSVLQVNDDARLAGRVLRYHTWPHVRPQTVAEHSWQVCRILLAIAPEYCAVLLPHAIVHDIGEIGTGDVPYPVKKENEELGNLMDDLEHEVAHEICTTWMLPMPICNWDQDLRWTFKLAEFIEMWEWGLEEMLLGNEFARLVSERCNAVACRMVSDGLKRDQTTPIAERANKYMVKRSMEWVR